MTSQDWDDAQVVAALNQLDDAEAAALVELLEESPGILRQTLEEYGYLGQESEDDDDVFITHHEGTDITEAQRELANHIDGRLDTAKTADELVEMVGSEGAEFRQQYNSAQYRSWLSEQLNALVQAGKIGRYRDGRNVYYTETPIEAIREWVRSSELLLDDLSVDNTTQIANDTEMPASTVRNAIRSYIRNNE
jgi:hypothetical protein